MRYIVPIKSSPMEGKWAAYGDKLLIADYEEYSGPLKRRQFGALSKMVPGGLLGYVIKEPVFTSCMNFL